VSSMPPAFPECSELELSSEQLRQWVVELVSEAEILELKAKGGRNLHARDESGSLPDLIHGLEAEQLRAVQVVYRLATCARVDTILRRDTGFRLIRRELEA